MSTTTELMPATGDRALTAAEIRAQVNLIQEVMRAVMKDGTHYGTIPGTPKPTLYKAGAEKILSTFRIAIEPVVEDLSIQGEEARYRVQTRATNQATGAFLGAGIGECSSSEEKYRWRGAVCQEEWDETPEDRRRRVWKKGRGDSQPYTILQVRTNPADVANTILKMAKKRSQIDACLTVTAASDVFAQDIEDLPEELQPELAHENGQPAKAPIQPPQRRSAAPAARPAAASPAPHNGNGIISEPQAKRFFAIAKQAGWADDELKHWLLETYGYESSRKIERSRYDEICQAVAGGTGNDGGAE